MVLIPDLESFDIIELSSSGGKDSLAQCAYVARLLAERGILHRGVVVHANLGRVEWPGTPALVAAQAAHIGLRFVEVSRPQGDLLQHVEEMGFWPKPSTRYCTADHKRGQILRMLTMLAEEVRRERLAAFYRHEASCLDEPYRPIRVLNCIGLRAEESTGRKKKPNLSLEKRGSGKGHRKTVHVWLPVQDWTEEEVWAECHASGAPIHPAYAHGLPRASCIFCIFAPREALVVSGRAHPELLAEYVRVERKIGHDFKVHLPLAQISADIAAGAQPSGMVPNWCM